MKKNPRLAALFTLFLFFSTFLFAQDTASFNWKVESKKAGDRKYELVFSTKTPVGWWLYAPEQLTDLQTTELQLEDTSITQEKLSEITASKTVSNTLFGAAKVYDDSVTWKTTIQFFSEPPAIIQGKLLYTYGKEPDVFYPSTPFAFTVPLEGGKVIASRILIPTIDINNPVSECGDKVKEDSSLFAIFLLGLFGGFIALLTPCVFPMIPLTVSFFTQKTEVRSRGVANAILYGFFIFLIYVLLTIPFHIAGKTNPEIFNNISTDVLLNIIFFVIFLVFAISFFGYFELTLPSSIANRAGSKSGIGNIAGIFFMAITLAIVSFSCTGPILGTLLAGVAEEGPWPLTIGAAGFGLALGLPFAIFAMFPKWLQSMPRSGGWLTDVKVVLGFIELALAIKFLANADNVKQWGFLKREVFVVLWAIIGLAIVLYLSGVIRIGPRAGKKRFSTSRVIFILLFSIITLYLIPGVTNTKWARLKWISGFPPPVCYSIYSNPVNCDEPLLDYEQAIQLAKKENKPVLIDFTGWACVNCRRMEEKVWTKPQVEKLMKNEFILVSLYVDERTKLPPSQQTVYKSKSGVEKSLITIGDKWTTFQIDNFDATSQPQYAIISPDEKALVRTKFYTPNADEFAAWLQCGLDAYQKINAK